jgi:hypothetical protein
MLRAVHSRPRRASWWLGFACSLASLTLARTSAADEKDAETARGAPAEPRAAALGAAPERVHVTYALGADCPPPDAFEAELDARLGPTWKAAPDELARNLSIVASVTGDLRVVRMDYADDDGRTITRSVNAPTCAEALSMMGVITAVAIEAQRRETAPKSAAARETTPPERGARASVPQTKTPTERDNIVARPLTLEHEAGLRFGVSSGFGPRAALGAGAEWGLVVAEQFEVRAALEGRDTGTVPAADGHARFRFLAARGDVCVATLQLASWAGLPMCAGLEGGVFWAEGVYSPPAVTFERSRYVPWIAGLVTPRVRLSSLRAYLEFVPEIRVPFAGHTFVFDQPVRTAYTTPGIAFGLSLGAGIRFH